MPRIQVLPENYSGELTWIFFLAFCFKESRKECIIVDDVLAHDEHVQYLVPFQIKLLVVNHQEDAWNMKLGRMGAKGMSWAFVSVSWSYKIS